MEWSSFFVTFVAKKIYLLTVRISAVSATLDSRPKGCCQLGTDGDELRNRLLPCGRRRIRERNIPLGGCQGQAPEGWLLFFPRLGILEQAVAPCACH